MLTKDQYQILNSLADIKKHNKNPRNIRQKFQASRYNSDDVKFLEENRLMKINLLGEYQITPQGESELQNKF